MPCQVARKDLNMTGKKEDLGWTEKVVLRTTGGSGVIDPSTVTHIGHRMVKLRASAWDLVINKISSAKIICLRTRFNTCIYTAVPWDIWSIVALGSTKAILHYDICVGCRCEINLLTSCLWAQRNLLVVMHIVMPLFILELKFRVESEYFQPDRKFGRKPKLAVKSTTQLPPPKPIRWGY